MSNTDYKKLMEYLSAGVHGACQPWWGRHETEELIPCISVNGCLISVRQISWNYIGRRSPKGNKFIRPFCGTFNCINPDHLEVCKLKDTKSEIIDKILSGYEELEGYLYAGNWGDRCRIWHNEAHPYVYRDGYKCSIREILVEFKLGREPQKFDLITSLCGNKNCIHPNHIKHSIKRRRRKRSKSI